MLPLSQPLKEEWLTNTSWDFYVSGPIGDDFSIGSGGYMAHPDFSFPRTAL